MCARQQSVKTKLALRIRNDVGAILQVEAHARHTGLALPLFFAGRLNPILVAVRIYFADHIGSIGENAAHDRNFGRRYI